MIVAVVFVLAEYGGFVHAALNLVGRINLHPMGSGAYFCEFACSDQSTRQAFFTGRSNGAIAVVDMNTRKVVRFIPSSRQAAGPMR